MNVIAAAALVVVAGMAALEVVMHPDDTGRLEAALLFTAMAVVTIGATRAVPVVAARARSLGHTVAAVGLIAAGLIALAVGRGVADVPVGA